MPSAWQRFSVIACCLLLAVPAAARDIALKTNPFLRPVDLDKRQVTTEQDDGQVVAEMELRATMVAGQRSQANIGGLVIGLGEEVNGYQLIEVHPLHVVLDRDGESKEIRIANSDRGSRD